MLDGDDAAGDHGDDDGGGGGGALDQHREQHPHHQPHHRVGEEGTVVKYCACSKFAYKRNVLECTLNILKLKKKFEMRFVPISRRVFIIYSLLLLPAVLPAMSLNEVLRRSREHTNV